MAADARRPHHAPVTSTSQGPIAMTMNLPSRPLPVLLLALAAGAACAADADPRHMTVTEVDTAFTSLDLGTPGDGSGDQFTGTGDLLDAHGARVGASAYTCIAAAAGVSQCNLSYELPGGMVTSFGTTHPVSGASPVFDTRLPITGGTGRYAGASGELHLVQFDGTATLTFDFVLADRH
jgi:hypothetical protein